MKLGLASCVLFIFLAPAYGQSLPGKIRGYKVHDAKPTVAEESADPHREADITVGFGELKVSDLGLSRVVVEVDARFTANRHSGRIDLLSFRDFTIDGTPIEVDEYTGPFPFKKHTTVSLTKPVLASMRFTSVPRAVLKKLFAHPDEWSVKGTVFAFGKFKKLGIGFKRVIPITIDLKIKDPLRTLVRQ